VKNERRVVLMRAAERDLERIDPLEANGIVSAIKRFAESGFGDVKKLQGYSPASWRLRVGRYRVIYSVEASVIVVRKVSDRRDVYDR
jgi:mRNA interferase RelE/StbE